MSLILLLSGDKAGRAGEFTADAYLVSVVLETDEKFSNFARSTLANGIDADDVQLIVEYATNFPSLGDFRLHCQNELMLVTARAGTTFTVTRGIEGTTPAGHIAGTGVAHVMTAGSLQAALEQHLHASAETIRITGTISPASLTTDQDDWNPAGLHDIEWIKVNTSGASATVEITGIDAGVDGDQITITHVVAEDQYGIKLWFESLSSAAWNRIAYAGTVATSLTLWPRQSATLRYDGLADRWMVISTSGEFTDIPG